MEYIIQLFGEIPLSTVVIFIAAMIFLGMECKKAYTWIVTNHDKCQEKEDTLQQIAENVKFLKEKQEGIEIAVKELQKGQYEIAAKQEEFEAKNRQRKVNDLRDKLLQNYKYYTDIKRNPMQAWSEMEKEIFDKLFKDYEDLGGNGYMHTTVQPEMAALIVIPMSDPQKILELMKSRQG